MNQYKERPQLMEWFWIIICSLSTFLPYAQYHKHFEITESMNSCFIFVCVLFNISFAMYLINRYHRENRIAKINMVTKKHKASVGEHFWIIIQTLISLLPLFYEHVKDSNHLFTNMSNCVFYYPVMQLTILIVYLCVRSVRGIKLEDI